MIAAGTSAQAAAFNMGTKPSSFLPLWVKSVAKRIIIAGFISSEGWKRTPKIIIQRLDPWDATPIRLVTITATAAMA